MTDRPPPLVSIIVPIFNVEAYLDECLNSIRTQTYQNIEILLVEDCSTDKSLSRAKVHLGDQRVKLLRHKRNRGLSAARNTGIENAAGSYIIFVDSDDVVATNLVQNCITTMERESLPVLLFRYKAFKDGDLFSQAQQNDEPPSASERFEGIEYFRYPHFAWLKVIRADVFRNRALRFPEGQNYEDWPFHWQLGFLVEDIRYIDQPLIFYRLRKGSITWDGDLKLLDILSANLLVAQIVEAHTSDTLIRKVLSEKLNSGAWYVISKVQSRYLSEAVLETRRFSNATRAIRDTDGESLKHRALHTLLALPRPLAIKGAAVMRVVLHSLALVRQRLSR